MYMVIIVIISDHTYHIYWNRLAMKYVHCTSFADAVPIDMITMITNDNYDNHVHIPFTINMITINIFV